jgi:hypothetical protein
MNWLAFLFGYYSIEERINFYHDKKGSLSDIKVLSFFSINAIKFEVD